MSRNTRRSSVALSMNSETPEDTQENEGGRKLRSKASDATTSTATRRSVRSKSSVPLYNLPESSTEESPSPDRRRATSRLNRPVRKAKSSTTKAVTPKPDSDQNAEDDAAEETGRKSKRIPKPVQRYVDEAVELSLSQGTSASSRVNTPTTTDEGTRKSNRTRKGDASTVTPTLAKVTRKGNAVTSVDTPETPRSLRKNALQTQETATSVDNPGTPLSSRRTTVQKQGSAKSSGTPSGTKKDNILKPTEDVQVKKLEWKFNVYGIPKCPLPCREAQFEEIWKFLFENVTEKNSGCMYVSGVPGTGKTVIVQTVIDTMQKINGKDKKNLQFKYLYINGLTLASPDKIWKRMFKGLDLPSKSHGISTKEALKRLDSYFESHQRNPVILVVDELDQILDKQQSILYQLLEWSSHAKNMFSFVAIFNTMSLPENGLAMRNYSRMGFKRAVFPPYSYEQLQTIVSNMLTTFKTSKLSAESVTLLSRKVAAISGDARRALEIARRAMEIAESGNLSGIQAVSNAFKEIFSSAKIETIKHTSLLEQLILKSICDEVRCSGVEEVLTAKIYENVIPKAVYEGMQWPKDEILKALMRLALMHLVIVEENLPSLHKRVLLKVPVEDVNFALGIQDLEN